jgi:hypothetical protein
LTTALEMIQKSETGSRGTLQQSVGLMDLSTEGQTKEKSVVNVVTIVVKRG